MGSVPPSLSLHPQDHGSSPFYFGVCLETGTAYISDQHGGGFHCKFLLDLSNSL